MSSRRRRPLPFMLRVPPNAEMLFSIGMVVLDALVLNAVVLSVYQFWLTPTSQGIYIDAYYNVRLILFGLYFVFGALLTRFSLRHVGNVADNFSGSASSLLAVFVSFNLLLFLSRELARQAHNFPRPVLLMSTVVAIFALFLLRVALSSLFKPYPRLRRAFIVGDDEEGRRILRHMHMNGQERFKILRVFKAAEIDQLAAEVVFHRVDEVIVTDPHVSLDKFWAQIYYGRKAEPHPFRVRLAVDPSTATGVFGLRSLDDLPLLTVGSDALGPIGRFVKRTFDICFAIFALIITSPVLLLTAIAVRLDSPGPIFYKQKRVGRFGREFYVIKFRSMTVDAEKGKGPQIATEHDPRVTRIGRWLRGLGIDELPQFFSVLIGEMSVVGPRPERPFFVEQHPEFQGRRLAVRPLRLSRGSPAHRPGGDRVGRGECALLSEAHRQGQLRLHLSRQCRSVARHQDHLPDDLGRAVSGQAVDERPDHQRRYQRGYLIAVFSPAAGVSLRRVPARLFR